MGQGLRNLYRVHYSPKYLIATDHPTPLKDLFVNYPNDFFGDVKLDGEGHNCLNVWMRDDQQKQLQRIYPQTIVSRLLVAGHQ